MCVISLWLRKNTQIYIYSKLHISSSSNICTTFPHTFFNIVQRPFGFRKEISLIGFYVRWEHWHIFRSYVNPVFCWLLAKKWKACYLSTVSAYPFQQYWWQICICRRKRDLYPYLLLLNHFKSPSVKFNFV